jgi:hypothetical protein
MRKIRLLLSLVLVAFPAAAGVTACGGDDGASSSGGPPDASANDGNNNGDTGASQDSGSSAPQAKASAVSAYLGQSVALDGSSSTGPNGFTYSWVVKAVPAGSAIATSSLAGATTAKPTFVPDKPGAYALTLTITAGAATSSVDVAATVVDPPVFYFHTENDAGAEFQASLNVVGAAAGNNGSAVSCFSRDGGSYDFLAANSAKVGTDWWEAPAGEPSRVVFGFETPADGGSTSILAATTSAATCVTPPTKLDTYVGDPPGGRSFEQPHFSPSGNRIAYVRNNVEGARIATIGFDGSSPRVVSALLALVDGGPNPDAGVEGVPGARPVWVDETTVAWLQVLDGANWQIVSAPDAANAAPTLLMSCTGEAPSQFDFLPSGEVIVSQASGTGNEKVSNIVAYPITAATKACGAARNISQLTSTSANSFAADFSLSPDKTRVAYQTNDDTAAKQEVVVARVDGTTPPVSIAAPLSGSNRGPRWVGGGAFITWGINGAQFDAGLTGNAVAVVAADGGAGRAAAISQPGTTTQAIGNGRFSCSFAPAVGSGVSVFGIAGILALRLVRRRRPLTPFSR